MRFVVHGALQELCFDSEDAAKTAHAVCVTGRERPHEPFGRLKAAQCGSLPPKLRFLSAVFFQGSELAAASFGDDCASERQNARASIRPEHCVCFCVLSTPRLRRRQETAGASRDRCQNQPVVGRSNRKIAARAVRPGVRLFPKICKALAREQKQNGASLHSETQCPRFSGLQTLWISKASALGNTG